MTISILVEPTSLGFRAETVGTLHLSAEASTSSDAIAALQSQIAYRVQNGVIIVQLPVPPPSPIAILPLAENPLVDEWLAAVEEFRNQRDAEDQAAFAEEIVQ